MPEGIKPIADIIEDFEFIDDWEDRYRYVIELGKALPHLPDEHRTGRTKVNGCVSQVWLHQTIDDKGSEIPRLYYQGDSDAHIVRGLIAILFGIFSGRRADEILKTDALALFNQLGLEDHLTQQRSNGLHSMVNRIRSDAELATKT